MNPIFTNRNHRDEGQKNYVMKKSTISLCIFYIFVFVSCNSYKYGAEESAQKSNLTFGTVKSKIIKGETTQAEILQLFGNPNLTTKNKSNNEVWSYNKMAVVNKGGNSSFIDGSRASVSSSSQSFDLIITFDDKDIVLDYSVVSSSF